MPYLDEYYGMDAPVANDIPSPMQGTYQPEAAAITGAGRAKLPAGGWTDDIWNKARDWADQNLFSGGATDIRNMASALGPAMQAAGGLGRALTWAQRAGVPAKAPHGYEVADQMFDFSRAAPVMRAVTGLGAAGGAGAAAAAQPGAGYDMQQQNAWAGELAQREQARQQFAQRPETWSTPTPNPMRESWVQNPLRGQSLFGGSDVLPADLANMIEMQRLRQRMAGR